MYRVLTYKEYAVEYPEANKEWPYWGLLLTDEEYFQLKRVFPKRLKKYPGHFPIIEADCVHIDLESLSQEELFNLLLKVRREFGGEE